MYIQTLVPCLGGLPVKQKMASRGGLVVPDCLNVHRELIFIAVNQSKKKT